MHEATDPALGSFTPVRTCLQREGISTRQTGRAVVFMLAWQALHITGISSTLCGMIRLHITILTGYKRLERYIP
jgi:hypothetical protein